MMRTYNIALLHYSCPPVVGGVEEIILQQASLFIRYHHPVKVLAGMGDYFQSGIEIEIHPLLSSMHAEIRKLQKSPDKNFDGLQRISQQIEGILKDSLADFDILIAHNVLSMPYNLPLTMALHRLADSRFINVVTWNHDSPYFYSRYPAELDLEPFKILKSYNPNIHYVTISDSRKEEFESLYNGSSSKLTVIPNGIDPIRFFNLDPIIVRLIQTEKLFESELILVQPSRLHPRKNVELSIRLLHALHKKGRKAKFLLTGAFDPHEKKTLHYYNKLMRLAEALNVRDHLIVVANYRFPSGEVLPASRVTIHDLYLISDVLFMPSKQEGFGIPLLEAGMIKLPVVCSDIPPFRSVATDHVLYFSLDDEPEKIATDMLRFLEELKPARWFRTTINNYTWDNIYRRQLKPFLDSVYQSTRA